MDVGGTSIKYGVVNDQGKIINTDKIVTPDSLEKMYQAMGEIYHNCNYEVAGIALSMPGADPVLYRKDTSLLSVELLSCKSIIK